MAYKEIINSKNISNNLEQNIAFIFKKALSDSKITGQSLESIIYEILEYIEENSKNEEHLIKNTKVIRQILIENSKENINNSYKKFITAKRVCKESINKEYALIDEFLDTIQDYAKTNNYQNLFNEFLDKNKLLEDLEKNIRYNSLKNRKTHV